VNQFLRNFISKINIRLAKNLSDENRDKLRAIMVNELIEFLWPKNQLRDGSQTENQGRKSGEVAWRISRNELNPGNNEPIIIMPSTAEIVKRRFILTYDCVNDRYFRPNDICSQPIIGWSSMLYKFDGICRKIEQDWKKTYLCMKSGKKRGELIWKIEHKDHSIKKVRVDMGKMEEFYSGKIHATLCCGDMCAEIPKENGTIELDTVGKAHYTEICVNFSGGDGDLSWQHSQLFRTDNDDSKHNMSVVIDFE